MPKIRKRTSKRVGLKLQHSIKKRIKEHNKKARRAAKDAPPKRVKKDPGIPNLWPYKEAMIQQIEEAKEREEEERQRQKDKRKKALDKKRAQNEARDAAEEAPAPRVSALAKRRWFFKEMKQVVDAADVILEVLDARDPLGCRCREIEQMVQSKMQAHGTNPKIVVLVLNKIDLVPPEVARKWVAYLRKELPTIAFKASTQKGARKIAQISGDKADHQSPEDLQKSGAVGASSLVQLLKKYALFGKSMQKKKKKITVGIIGYPNVGKSSLINSLKRERAAGVSSTPGFTTNVQTFRLDGDIELIDSPGVMFATDADEIELVLRNCIKPDQLSDPVAAAQAVLERCGKERLQELYSIAEFSSTENFLALLAAKRGKLGKGGVPQLLDAAKVVLRDWNEGRIPYYTAPPEDAPASSASSTEIVAGFSKEFDIEALLKQADTEVDRELKEADAAAMADEAGEGDGEKKAKARPRQRDFAVLASRAPFKMDLSALTSAESKEGPVDIDEDEDEDTSGDEEEEGKGSSAAQKFVFNPGKESGAATTERKSRAVVRQFVDPEEQRNQSQKKALQKAKKQQGKMERRFGKAAFMAGGEGAGGMEDEDDGPVKNPFAVGNA